MLITLSYQRATGRKPHYFVARQLSWASKVQSRSSRSRSALMAFENLARLELGMEGHRLFDIRRWGNGEQIMNDYIVNEARTIPTIAGKFQPYTSKHDVLPIPLTAIDLSQNVLEQNAGW